MQHPSSFLQQALASDVVRERVLEHEDELGVERPFEDELGGFQLPKARLSSGSETRGPIEQPDGELSSDHRGRLQGPARFILEAVESSHDHVLDRVRDARWDRCPASLDQRPGDLFDEERVAFRLQGYRGAERLGSAAPPSAAWASEIASDSERLGSRTLA